MWRPLAQVAARWAWLIVLVVGLACSSPPADGGAAVAANQDVQSTPVSAETIATVSALATLLTTGGRTTAALGAVTATRSPNAPVPRPPSVTTVPSPTPSPTLILGPVQPTWSTPETPVATVPAEMLSLVLDTEFSSPLDGWPNDPSGTAWFADDGYHLFARSAGRFVGVGAPIGAPRKDTLVTVSFRKVAGPPRGGYGLIVRDADPDKRDGHNQFGHFYVAAVGDEGDVGIWRRDGDHWVDLAPWSLSLAVHTGFAGNEVQLRTTGQNLVLLVNGVVAAQAENDALADGGVGLFVGGDGNQAVASSYRVQVAH